MDSDSGFDSSDDVDEKGQTERVESQLFGCYIFCLYFLEFDCPSQNDQLVAGSVVGPDQLVYLDSYFLRGEGIELCDMHVVFYDLQ